MFLIEYHFVFKVYGANQQLEIAFNGRLTIVKFFYYKIFIAGSLQYLLCCIKF